MKYFPIHSVFGLIEKADKRHTDKPNQLHISHTNRHPHPLNNRAVQIEEYIEWSSTIANVK